MHNLFSINVYSTSNLFPTSEERDKGHASRVEGY